MPAPGPPREGERAEQVGNPDQRGDERGVPVRGGEGEDDSSFPGADGYRLERAGRTNGGVRRPDLGGPTGHGELQPVQHGRTGARDRDGRKSRRSDPAGGAGGGEEGSGRRKAPDVSDRVGIDAAGS